MSRLGSRLVVALLLLPPVLGLVWLGSWFLFGLALLAGLLALHELYGMARALRPLVLAGFAGLLLALLGVQLGGLPWFLGGLLATVALAFVLFGVSDARPPSAIASLATTVLGVVWVGGGLGSLLVLRDLSEHGRLAIFTVMLAVFADDTAAFVVGRLLGRHRMAPAISPGKTWEGFVAGTVAAMAVAFFALYDQEFLTNAQALALGAAVAIAATVGDLFESAVKRDAGVKDSGRLLGGHGGVLDRLDAHLFAGAVAFFVILAFGHAPTV
jgi:phosphatidate cytidylyltransferase